MKAYAQNNRSKKKLNSGRDHRPSVIQNYLGETKAQGCEGVR